VFESVWEWICDYELEQASLISTPIARAVVSTNEFKDREGAYRGLAYEQTQLRRKQALGKVDKDMAQLYLKLLNDVELPLWALQNCEYEILQIAAEE
jgi:hypothetical protein